MKCYVQFKLTMCFSVEYLVICICMYVKKWLTSLHVLCYHRKFDYSILHLRILQASLSHVRMLLPHSRNRLVMVKQEVRTSVYWCA